MYTYQERRNKTARSKRNNFFYLILILFCRFLIFGIQSQAPGVFLSNGGGHVFFLSCFPVFWPAGSVASRHAGGRPRKGGVCSVLLGKKKGDTYKRPIGSDDKLFLHVWMRYPNLIFNVWQPSETHKWIQRKTCLDPGSEPWTKKIKIKRFRKIHTCIDVGD